MARFAYDGPMHKQIATFAAGCFWGVEDLFRKVPGVIDAISGYTGGTTEHPTYKQVCTGETGHAEAVEVSYDADVVSYETLLDTFWKMHDPTQLNRQGPDHGTQYRTAIFTHDSAQQMAAEASKAALEASGKYQKPITTQILPAPIFWKAEEYHQHYFEKHGGGGCHI